MTLATHQRSKRGKIWNRMFSSIGIGFCLKSSREKQYAKAHAKKCSFPSSLSFLLPPLNSAMMTHHSWDSGRRREKNSRNDLFDENQTWNGRNLSLNILSFRFYNLENHQKFLNINATLENHPNWKRSSLLVTCVVYSHTVGHILCDFR